jgi:uncharacterized membrane protein
MRNRNVGWLVIGISFFIAGIIWLFNYSLRNVVGATCSHGPTCSMYDSLKVQTWLSISIALVILIIGLFLVFSKEHEKIVIKKIKATANISPKEFDKKNLKNLDKEELAVMNTILQNKGSVFQSELVNKTGLNKVKITRILDSLEGQGLIERKRRGMTNIVILKNN